MHVSCISNKLQVWFNVLVQSQHTQLTFQFCYHLHHKCHVGIWIHISMHYLLHFLVPTSFSLMNCYTKSSSSFSHWHHPAIISVQMCTTMSPKQQQTVLTSIKAVSTVFILACEIPYSSHSSSLITSRGERGSKGLPWLSVSSKRERKKRN